MAPAVAPAEREADGVARGLARGATSARVSERPRATVLFDTTTAPPEPRSCQRLHEETDKCETGMRSCDQHVIARLEAQCQRDEKRLPRDGGRP
jgi:hypothetical protein